MAFIASIAAVISYNDGLFIARLAGNHGRLAYLYPLLPDGLIVICLIALYEAARIRAPRPRWATAGLVLGAGLTLAMNVGAGAAHSRLDALVDAFVPAIFFVAVEVLIWLIRRGRGALSPSILGVVPATPGHPEPPTTDAALAVLLGTASQRGLADALGVPRSRVTAWAARVAPVADDPPAGVPGVAPAPAGAASLNGDGGHA